MAATTKAAAACWAVWQVSTAWQPEAAAHKATFAQATTGTIRKALAIAEGGPSDTSAASPCDRDTWHAASTATATALTETAAPTEATALVGRARHH